jgi:DNA-directed RNA polymerase sigma subunit (sigma70/sigma32)
MTLFKNCGLTPIEECITKMRCGVDCVPHTPEQIAAELGATRERIHQIGAGALRKLRHGLKTKESSAAQR